MAFSPMMRQYLATKEQYPDCILFYRLGDFYEMFFDDAKTAARELDLVLTGKQCGEEERAPMCGVPYHACENYIARLVEKGYKVAIAEQLTDPALSKGLVERDVIRVVTPGTVLSDAILNEKDNNFLASLYEGDGGFGLSWCDISTGEFFALQLAGEDSRQMLLAQITKIQPKEVLVNVTEEEDPWLWEQLSYMDGLYAFRAGNDTFGLRVCSENIRRHFGAESEKAVGLAEEDVPLLFYAVGSILGYIRLTQKQDVTHLQKLQIQDAGDSMNLDKATIKNLELTETLFEHKVQGSLLGVLDRCRTAMGSRKMKQWLRQPLNSLTPIQKRLDAVELLSEDILLRNDLRESLKYVYDLERLTARFACGTANARDLIALKTSLLHASDIREALRGREGLTGELSSAIDALPAVSEEIEAAIVDEPPFSVREGGMIRPGYSAELDELNASSRDAKVWIASLENTEKERTGIKTLKVGYNKVFGYYIEVSNSFKDQVPENYIRKQTLVGGERFITSEMKEMESIVLNAQTKINDLEYRLFTELRKEIQELSDVLQRTGSAIAQIDVLCSFAESSVKLNYVKPEVNAGDEIVIRKGRHPVIETTIKDGVFVSNDVYLDRDDASMLLITGPNMAGKSTYMRQLALIVLMAQAGCFVPAESAQIGLCDRIYTRIGASDNIAMGQSTFFVEMSELAYILNTATEKSLVILDEIGRGTSTYDGLSIAWATVERLTKPERRVRTLFATHYHELTVLADTIRGVKNLNVDVSESGGNIVFLHKIVEGSASRSYGIHVAKLAGVPKEVLENAQAKLDSLESAQPAEIPVTPQKKGKEQPAEPGQQLSLFTPVDSELANMVRNLDLMNITPSQAIGILEELQEKARQ
ncbi:MAG: DNA mismatch repair protein MutS [Firmicutes bacterium]|nr:DNA mismatch repair protein MutS [Bacillota bacterium]